MPDRRFVLAALAALALAAPALEAAVIPRTPDDLAITLAGGKQVTLSQYKGKVVALMGERAPAPTGKGVPKAPVAFGQVPHQNHPPSSANEYAKVLEDPARDEWQKPHDVVMALALKSTEIIADIGAGTGYFARRFALHAGKVYAVDIDDKLLDIVRKGAPANLEAVLASPDDPRLPERSIDTVFFCDVLHHIENRPAYYARLAKALKPGGRMVVVDFFKKELPVGPPPAMKLSDDEVVAELKAAGFTLTKRLDILPYQYYLFFEKR